MKLWLYSLCLCLLPAMAQAYQWRTGAGTNALVVAAGEVLAEETLLVANSLDIQGTARRDLWLGAATGVRMSGESAGDLRILANSAVVDGAARQNLLAYARGLHLTTNASVQGEAALFGTTVICEGAVAGDAWIHGQSVTLGGTWGGNVRVQATEIRIVPGTTIAGDLLHATSKPLAYDSSVAIGGEVKPIRALLPDAGTFSSGAAQARFVLHGYLFLGALIAGMPFVGFFPQVAGGAVRRLRTSPWRVLLAGAVTLLLGPVLIAFAFMTVVGIPLALLLGAGYAALAYLAHVVIALWLGHMLFRARAPQTFARVLLALATGLFLFYFATALPGIAAFVIPPVLVLGTGALMLALGPRPLIAIPAPPAGPPPLPGPFETPNKPEQGASP